MQRNVNDNDFVDIEKERMRVRLREKVLQKSIEIFDCIYKSNVS